MCCAEDPTSRFEARYQPRSKVNRTAYLKDRKSTVSQRHHVLVWRDTETGYQTIQRGRRVEQVPQYVTCKEKKKGILILICFKKRYGTG